MKKLILTLTLLSSFISTSQENIRFKDGQSINFFKLNQQLINIVGESNLSLPNSSIEQFTFCFFNNIAKQSSYRTYQQDLTKTINHSKNNDERMYFLYSIKYVNSALLNCLKSSTLLKEYSKVDKIIPQSDIKIKAFANEHLNDLKKELGMSDYIELGKGVDLESYAECYVRKIWSTFTPKEMFEDNPQTQKKSENLMEDCIDQNLIPQEINNKYDSNFIADESLLGNYISFVNDPKSKGLNFKIKSPAGFINTFANSPNIIRLWRKENASKNDDPWIYILILNDKMYEDKEEFEKELIDGGAIYIANATPNSHNIHYLSAGNYPGVMYDFDNKGVQITTISLYLENHLVQFFYADKTSLNKDEYDKFRNILIAFAKSIKFI